MCSQPRHSLPTHPEPKNKQVADYYSVLHSTSHADDQSVRENLQTQQLSPSEIFIHTAYNWMMHTLCECLQLMVCAI